MQGPIIDARARARAIAAGQRVLADRQPLADHIHYHQPVTIPAPALAVATALLSPSAVGVYVHLWGLAARYGRGPNRWWWRPDDYLSTDSSIPTRTIRRARADIRDAGLIHATVGTRDSRPTWYCVLWPIPQPSIDLPRTVRADLAADITRNGSPLTAPDAWVRLAQAMHVAHDDLGIVADLRGAIGPPERSNIIAAARHKLSKSHPYLEAQLAWVAPTCPASSALHNPRPLQPMLRLR